MGGIQNMIKQDHCDCCCGDNTFIGFSNSYDNGYCKACGNIFTYHWNGCKPLSEDKTCPKCGSFDEVESEHRIEEHISMLKMFKEWKDVTEKQRKGFIKQINELNRIRREFDKYNEEKEKKREEEREEEREKHEKRNRDYEKEVNKVY
jgi:hypothetical protein